MMTIKGLMPRLLLTGVFFLLPRLYAHDNVTVHPMLMDKSYEAWCVQTNQAFFKDLDIDPSDTPTFEDQPIGSPSLIMEDIRPGKGTWTNQPWTLKQWLMAGAIDEDAHVARCLAHFYDPIRDDHFLTDPVDTYASDSFEWGTTGTSFLGVSTNQESWQKARDYYFDALTKETLSERDENLAHTFYALGQVSHLLQDLSAPEHVRNDAHPMDGQCGLPTARWFERYGKNYVVALDDSIGTVSALDWSAAGFTMVEDFWNRGIYRGALADLDADASGSKLLGLSEFTNGNFLGSDATYAELTSFDLLHHAPFPRLADTTYGDFHLGGCIKADTWTDLAKTNPTSGRIRKSIFLIKKSAGVLVEKHSVLNYSQWYSFRIFGNTHELKTGAKTTINAPDVLAKHHKILLPKAVQYTAGLLDYFFRGKLDVRITWDKDSDNYKLAITNKSGKAFKGGAFTLYQDSNDACETRSIVNSLEVDEGSWDESSILEADETINATFQPSSGESKGFMLVYQGIIGLDESNNEADPVEGGHAIAAYHFQLLRFNITWDIASDIDLYLTDPNGDVIWYEEPVSSLGELDNDDIGGTGPENITLKQLVPGDYQVWVNFFRDWYPDDFSDEDPVSGELMDVTPVDVELNTYYNSSTPLDNVSFELTEPNEGEDRPEDTTGPATQASWYVRKLITVDENGVVTQH